MQKVYVDYYTFQKTFHYDENKYINNCLFYKVFFKANDFLLVYRSNTIELVQSTGVSINVALYFLPRGLILV